MLSLCGALTARACPRRYYVLRNNVVEKVRKLLQRKERWLVVAAVRFLRTCIGLKDDFYNRYLVRCPLLSASVLPLAAHALAQGFRPCPCSPALPAWPCQSLQGRRHCHLVWA